MDNQRKYFDFGISRLEKVFESATNNIGTLEELEEALEQRNTKRAQRLLDKVRLLLEEENEDTSPSDDVEQLPVTAALNGESATTSNNSQYQVQIEEDINWDSFFDEVQTESSFKKNIAEELPNDNPLDILESWIAIEALSPQSYKTPQDIKNTDGSVAYFKDGEPWCKNENPQDKCNLYYSIYLGEIDLGKATENLISIYQDTRPERPKKYGSTTLGVILVDKDGIPIPETGISLSSFSWAYGQACNGKLKKIKYWERAEELLLQKLEKMVYQQNQKGEVKPLDIAKIENIYQWLVKQCKIPEKDAYKPSFSIRINQALSKGEPDTPLLNSFYLGDLLWASAKIKEGNENFSLSCFLGKEKPSKKNDLLQDKKYLQNILQPKYTPLGRWPGRGRHSLVLLQQVAVNLANRELQEQGLFSVNGPPGTGKTTLLRDVIARNIVERAIKLSDYKNVNDAFSHEGKIKVGAGFAHLYGLKDDIRGFEMLVASTNNKAVENISKELPLRSEIADDLHDLSFFKTPSNALLKGKKTWGMIAAALGKSKNRSHFINKVWWDENSGLKTYFKSIMGQVSRDPDDYDDGIVPQIIEECDAPLNQEDAEKKWIEACDNFNEALIKVRKNSETAQTFYDDLVFLESYEGKLHTIKTSIQEQETNVFQQKKVFLEKKKKNTDADKALEYAQDHRDDYLKKQPQLIIRFFQRKKYQEWKSHSEVLQDTIKLKKKICSNNRYASSKAGKDYNEVTIELNALNNERKALEVAFEKASLSAINAKTVCEGRLVTRQLWNISHEEQQLFTPTFSSKAHLARDELFVSAIQLHKAFIDVSAKQIKNNLMAFFFILGNGKLPKEKQQMLPHLWSTAFLFTPIISTTFASIRSLLNDMPVDSLGWLLIDEAGQAIPQAAVGAILRSKRVMAVGDPMQIEPVVSLPLPLIGSICKHYSVNPYKWSAPYSSIQTLSDEANAFGTIVPRDLNDIWIGSPLLVHRRCENPMFKASNQLAYNNQMVSATSVKDSSLTSILGKSQWYDIVGSSQDKWCAEEGELVAKMINNTAEELGSELDLFIITPFKIVAQNMRKRMKKDMEKLKQHGIENPSQWIEDSIGTVHTFQGKEAQGVIFLLGASNPNQDGARNWVTSNVNILNVAVSRAKQNFYIVGNHSLWSKMGNMKIINSLLK